MSTHTPIRKLSDNAINQIAAGEVVERPAAVVKELLENALDAQATKIDVSILDGGRHLVYVTDNGIGIPKAELTLALERHATSKIDGSDLLNIQSFGFRGEALPSIAAVARLEIQSRFGQDDAWSVTAEAGQIGALHPCALPHGTSVRVQDLFFATPARLKFLKSDRTETQAISDIVRHHALAHADVAFHVFEGNKTILRTTHETGDMFEARLARLRKILGSEFADNTLPIDATREDIDLQGFVSLPTFNRGTATWQYFIVNGRPVRDKLLVGALRGAYADVLPKGRHCAAVLFLTLPPQKVDVNVHPAKTELRFRDPGLVRGLVVSAIKHALAQAGCRTATTTQLGALGAFQAPNTSAARPKSTYQASYSSPVKSTAALTLQEPDKNFHQFTPEAPEPQQDMLAETPLGMARAQIHKNYILAETPTGFVLVDQHAAHERLVYEQLKTAYAARNVQTQTLLIPEVVEIPAPAIDALLEADAMLREAGLELEPFGQGAVCVRAIPALLLRENIKTLVQDIADALNETQDVLSERINHILATLACYGSVRSGRVLTVDEMNQMLRDMEATPLSSQCNHGRPTFVQLSLKDVERLFERR